MWTQKRDSNLFALIAVLAGAAGGCSGDEEPAITDDPDRYRAAGVTLTRVEALQSLAVPLVADSAAVAKPAAPVVRSFPTVLRVGAALSGDAAARSKNVMAIALFEDAAGKRFTRVSPAHAPQDFALPSLASTWQIPLELTDLREGLRFRVVLVDADRGKGSAEEARFPRDASLMPIASEETGSLEIAIVPVRWTLDGSNRLPDTSEKQVALYRNLFERVYPARKVNLTVREPINAPSRGTFSAINDALLQIRSREDTPARVYLHALASPAATFEEFCRGGCTTGLGYVVDDPADGSIRVSSGVGFTGIDSGWTMIHEVGHQHGREHAPCGTSGSDRNFPQRDGTIGLWGYERNTPTMLNVRSHDFMSYCDDEWVSQYTWAGLLARIRAVGSPAQEERVGSRAKVVVRFVHREGGRVVHVGEPVAIAPLHARETERMTLELDAGAREVVAVPVVRNGEGTGDMLAVPVEHVSAAVLAGGERVVFRPLK
jgi:hypothetical protein